MSNKRRKNRGSKKIARNLAIRIRRGAVRLGNPLPGHGRNTATVAVDKLREDLDTYTATYWRGS